MGLRPSLRESTLFIGESLQRGFREGARRTDDERGLAVRDVDTTGFARHALEHLKSGSTTHTQRCNEHNVLYTWASLRTSGSISAPRQLTETSSESRRRYLGSAYETEQWTEAHERERSKEVKAGNRGLEVNIESGRTLDALYSTYKLPIEIREVGDVNIIARTGDDKINFHSPQVTFTIFEF